MKLCTGLWIVAPITRAVDDKTAKSLLGDSFKRQLKFDGTYSAVTFICSKTDDISITEAAESLGLDDKISEAMSEVEAMKITISTLKGDKATWRKDKMTYSDAFDECESQCETWEALERQLEDGKPVYAPPDKPRKQQKRKRVADYFRSRKRPSPHSDNGSAGSNSEGGSD